ncbi:MAG TPA: hypothetical protein VJ868_07855, partial [Actinomycetota bacterium]|nr:hypothetical protein [Actinomycetota bacterium]
LHTHRPLRLAGGLGLGVTGVAEDLVSLGAVGIVHVAIPSQEVVAEHPVQLRASLQHLSRVIGDALQ